MATEYVTYYDKYGNKRSFPKPDNWEDRNKEENNKKEDQLPTNPRDIVKYYFNKGEFEKAKNTIKEYGLEDEEEEFIDSLNNKQRSDYMDYLSKNSWEEVDSKSVQDSDGFTTDYTLYKKGDGTYRAVFGDKDLYKPDTDSDMDFANEKEAREWFKNYDGFKEENKKELNKLKKGDSFVNEYGTKVDIMEVDDKGQTLHKFTRENGTTDYKNFNEKDVRSMLQHNNYKKVSQDDIDKSSLFDLQDDDLEEKLSKMDDKEFVETIKNVENEIGVPRTSHPYKDNIFTREYFKRFGDPTYGNMVLKENPANLDLKRLGLEKSSPKTSSQDNIDNTYFNNYKKDQERLDNVINKMSKPVQKKEKTKEELEKENAKSGIFQKKETTKNFERGSKEHYDALVSSGMNKNDAQAIIDIEKGNLKHKEDQYGAYYEKENLGKPSNYKEGDKIEYKSGYGEKLTGTVVREATDKEKEFQMNKNLKGYVVKDEYGEHIVPDTRIQVGKTIAEANKAYKDNKPIIDSNKKTTNDYMNDKIRNSNNKTVKALGNELRKKNGPVGLNDAKNYMELDGSSFVVNYRDARGYTSGYMSNSGDNGNGISVRSGQINSLEKYLRENGYERKKSGYSEYVFTWEKPKKSKSQIAKDQLEKYKDSLKDPTKSKVTKADMLKKIFKK